MGTKLQRAGHRVVFAQDGAEALEKVGQQPFDLVFMDMQMPVMDGLMATQRIRQSEAASGQPPVMIVALTANVMPADEQRCLDAGMSGYMSKPFGREALAHWIGVAQQHKQEPGGNNGGHLANLFRVSASATQNPTTV